MGHFTHNFLESCRLLLLLLGVQSDFLAELSRIRHVAVVAASAAALVLFRNDGDPYLITGYLHRHTPRASPDAGSGDDDDDEMINQFIFCTFPIALCCTLLLHFYVADFE